MSKTCSGTTKKGKRCRKKTTHDSGFCHIHRKKVESKSDEPVLNTEPLEECCICLDSLCEDVHILKCKHKMHLNCVRLLRNASCPICRTEIVPTGKLTRKNIDEMTQKYKNDNVVQNELPQPGWFFVDENNNLIILI